MIEGGGRGKVMADNGGLFAAYLSFLDIIDMSLSPSVMQPSESLWSRIPAEIALEIVAHNADDVPSLRAMCLVSKNMRSLGIEHLFASIVFAREQDISWWRDMLQRTPRLRTIVKKVKFSALNFGDKAWRHPEMYPPEQLHEAVVPPQISTMPNVRVVEWEGWDDETAFFPVSMAVAYMPLFPNMVELDLSIITFNTMDDVVKLLGTCGKLRALLVCFLQVAHEDAPLSTVASSDPKALERLTIKSFTCILQLMTISPPAGLLSFRYIDVDIEDIQAAERVLQLAAPSLVNLELAPDFESDPDAILLEEQFRRMPALPSLETLTIPLLEAAPLLNALKAPTLTTLILRIPLFLKDVERDRAYFDTVLHNAFPWGGQSESMKSALMQKFPLLRRIKIHLSIPRNSPIHFRRGLRRRMERQLWEQLEETGADVSVSLELAWLDDDNNPVRYNKTSGKPPWTFRGRFKEPETEESDCESEGPESSDKSLDS
ncbi:hypothetical protein DFH06DRAFT_182776 [Mycena polygramma]|nr:hypothetical protein DFH06DRAFT_182776 [Mycena polygramma]